MSEEKTSCGAEAKQIEEAAAPIGRRGKRRNAMIIPGTSDPLIAQLYGITFMQTHLDTLSSA